MNAFVWIYFNRYNCSNSIVKGFSSFLIRMTVKILLNETL